MSISDGFSQKMKKKSFENKHQVNPSWTSFPKNFQFVAFQD
jgi:hypothetical protein